MFEQLDYIREEGRFKWNEKIDKRHQSKIGEYAGSQCSNKSHRVHIHGRNYYISHIVWYIENGNFPSGCLFFKDGDATNSHISNLSLYKDPLRTDNFKKCTRCKEYKNIDNFHQYEKLSPLCVECHRENSIVKYRALRLSNNEESIKIIKERNRKERERYQENRQYTEVMRQLESQEQQENP